MSVLFIQCPIPDDYYCLTQLSSVTAAALSVHSHTHPAHINANLSHSASAALISLHGPAKLTGTNRQ